MMVFMNLVFVLSKIIVLFSVSYITEAYVVVDDNGSLKPSSREHVPRRAFVSAGVCSAALLARSIQATAASDSSAQSDGNDVDKLMCRPSKSQLEKLSDTRAQIDMAVQASSVQAFQSAAELASDPLLDESLFKELLRSVSCENNPSLSKQLEENGVFLDILKSVANMQKTLNGSSTSKLTTEDAMAVMRYGTNARSTIDTIFSL